MPSTRPSRRASALATISVTALAGLVTLASAQPAAAGKPGSGTVTGTGQVFMVNPVQSSGDEGLTDQNDSDAAVPASAYARVQLRNLDGSGYLRGDWANVQSSTGTPAYSSTNTFLYTRHADQFEQVMGYFWVNQAQEYLQSLGFGSTLPGIVHESFPVKIDQYGGDNSYQTDKPYRVRLGKGGVDDAEDAEVIVHEYGHAVHASQVPGYGASLDAGSIGESFGDYFGVTVGLAAAQQYGWPVKTPQPCVADWDSTSYTSTVPHCLRRLDTNLTVADRQGEVHYDGQIWSRALWDIRQGYVQLGLGTRTWDTTLIDSQFGYAPDTSFSAAAAQTYQTALARNGADAAALVKASFAARGITLQGAPRGDFLPNRSAAHHHRVHRTPNRSAAHQVHEMRSAAHGLACAALLVFGRRCRRCQAACMRRRNTSCACKIWLTTSAARSRMTNRS